MSESATPAEPVKETSVFDDETSNAHAIVMQDFPRLKSKIRSVFKQADDAVSDIEARLADGIELSLGKEKHKCTADEFRGALGEKASAQLDRFVSLFRSALTECGFQKQPRMPIRRAVFVNAPQGATV